MKYYVEIDQEVLLQPQHVPRIALLVCSLVLSDRIPPHHTGSFHFDFYPAKTDRILGLRYVEPFLQELDSIA